MKISEALNKNNPVAQKREMSMTEYAKLVDANTELVDQIKELKNIINKAIEFLEPFIEFGNSITLKGSMLNPVYEILKGADKE